MTVTVHDPAQLDIPVPTYLAARLAGAEQHEIIRGTSLAGEAARASDSDLDGAAQTNKKRECS